LLREHVQECKIDACIDRFLAGLDEFSPLEKELPDFEEFKLSESTRPKLEKIRHQQDDLRLWAPDFLDKNTKDGSIDLNRIFDRIDERRAGWLHLIAVRGSRITNFVSLTN
jgi:hypothetical protein